MILLLDYAKPTYLCYGSVAHAQIPLPLLMQAGVQIERAMAVSVLDSSVSSVLDSSVSRGGVVQSAAEMPCFARFMLPPYAADDPGTCQGLCIGDSRTLER